MPIFICPIDWCVYHDGEDCTKTTINIKPRSNNYDVTIACQHQKEKLGKCEICGKEIRKSTTLCIDCITNRGYF